MTVQVHPPPTLAPPLSVDRYAALYDLRKNASTQTAHIIDFLCAQLPRVYAGRAQLELWSIGTGEGDVELALMDALDATGVSVRVMAVEPSLPQRRRLEARLARRGHTARVEVVPRSFEAFTATRQWDLVLLCQSAYYFAPADLPALLRRAWSYVSAGGSFMVVHQSAQGVPELQMRHMEALHGSRAFMLNGDDLHALLLDEPAVPYRPARDRHALPASLDVRRCLDPQSREGLDILSFCLECDLSRLSPGHLEAIRASVQSLSVERDGGRHLEEPVDVFWMQRDDSARTSTSLFAP
jgi:hypothetical protein